MKRSIKNVIMLIMILLMSAAITFSVCYAKSNSTSSTNNTEIQNNNTPPAMPNASNDKQNNNEPNSNGGNQNNMQSPPEKPGDNNSNSTDSSSLEKPSEDSSNSSDSKEKENKTEDSSSNNSETKNENQNAGMNMMPTNNMNQTSNDISCIYYIIFGIASLINALIIIYLIMSRFNKKTFKETFTNSDKITIYILSVILLTLISTYTCGKTTSYLTKEKNTNTENNTSNTSVAYSAVKEITKSTSITEGTFTSTNKDENAISVTGDVKTSISNVTVTKTGDSDGGDNTSFYGTNSAIIAANKANLTLKNITVTTDATGANGVFSYGGSATTNNSSSDNTTINISDSKITTKKDNSGGIMTTGGGITNATNLTINTSGTSSAAIRTDRGGGEVNVEKGTYQTTGKGSPAIYSTANIKVSNAKLVSKASEGVVIEGKNSVTLTNCTLTDNNTTLNGKSTTYKNIFLYQSMSGDAATGEATFTAKNSKITTKKGDTFYVTNTTATINLENNTFTNTDETSQFLRIQKDSWGNNGENGGNVTLNMKNQKVKGNIVVDSISTLEFSLKNSSSYEGTINKDKTAKSIKLTLDKSSKIKLTGDSYVTSLTDEDTTYSNIDFNGYKLYVNGNAIN